MTLGTLAKASALVLVGALGAARGGEEEIAIAKLPPAVKAAVKAKFPGAEWKGAAKETEGGETFFEVTLTYRGDKYDVVLEPDGEIEAIEREILVDALPTAVVKAIRAKHHDAKITKAEELTDEDGEVAYEVVVGSGKGAVEVIVSPKGKIKEAGKDDEKGEAEEKKGEKDDKGKKKEKKGEKDDEKGEGKGKAKKDKD